MPWRSRPTAGPWRVRTWTSRSGFWDMSTGKLKARIHEGVGWVKTLAFSPDGRRIAFGGRDCTVQLRELDGLGLVGRARTDPEPRSGKEFRQEFAAQIESNRDCTLGDSVRDESSRGG